MYGKDQRDYDSSCPTSGRLEEVAFHIEGPLNEMKEKYPMKNTTSSSVFPPRGYFLVGVTLVLCLFFIPALVNNSSNSISTLSSSSSRSPSLLQRRSDSTNLLPCPSKERPFVYGSLTANMEGHLEIFDPSQCMGSYSLYVWGPSGDGHIHQLVADVNVHWSRQTSMYSGPDVDIRGGVLVGIPDKYLAPAEKYQVAIVGITNSAAPAKPREDGEITDFARQRVISFSGGRANVGKVGGFSGELYILGPGASDHAHFILGTDGNGAVNGGGNYVAIGEGSEGRLAKINIHNDDDKNLIISGIEHEGNGNIYVGFLGSGANNIGHVGETPLKTVYKGSITPVLSSNDHNAYLDIPYNEKLTGIAFLRSEKCGHSAQYRIATAQVESSEYPYSQHVTYVYGSGDFQYSRGYVGAKVIRIYFEPQKKIACLSSPVDVTLAYVNEFNIREKPLLPPNKIDPEDPNPPSPPPPGPPGPNIMLKECLISYNDVPDTKVVWEKQGGWISFKVPVLFSRSKRTSWCLHFPSISPEFRDRIRHMITKCARTSAVSGIIAGISTSGAAVVPTVVAAFGTCVNAEAESGLNEVTKKYLNENLGLKKVTTTGDWKRRT